jgi:GAF domain-containing protein
VYETKSPIVLRDINDENGILLRLFQSAGLKSLLFIPILQDGFCVSHLSLSSFDSGAFPEEDIELLVTIADQISPALRNSTLHKTSYERTARLESMQRLNWQIAENLNLQKVLNSIVSAVVEFLHIDFVNIYFADGNEENLVSHCWGGSVPGPPPREGGKNSFPVDNTVGGRVYRTGEAAIIPDIQELSNWAEMEWVRKVGLHSFISQPLRHGGKNIGIINCMSREKDFFSQDDLEFLRGLASQAAIAIANARLHEEDTRRATRLETLQRLTRKMNENLALPDLLAAITSGSAELLDATRIAAISVDNKTNVPEVFYKHGLSANYVKNLLTHYKETTIPEAMRIMEPVAIENVFSPPFPIPKKLASDEGIGALLSVPLLYKGSSFGVLALYWDDPRVFSPVDIGLAKAFGDQVATAVQNARLHEEAQRSRDFFQSIMDDNADAMMVSDEEQKILRWN